MKGLFQSISTRCLPHQPWILSNCAIVEQGLIEDAIESGKIDKNELKVPTKKTYGHTSNNKASALTQPNVVSSTQTNIPNSNQPRQVVP